MASYTGLVAAAYCCLLINGFVGFQFAEDGTPTSLWVRSVSRLMTGALKPPRIVAFTDLLPCCLWGLVLHCHCDLQGLRRIPQYACYRTVDYLHSLAFDLRSHLHRLATNSGLPYTGRPVAHW